MSMGVSLHTRVFVCGMSTYVYLCVNIHMHRYILHTIRHLVAVCVCVCMCARMSTFSMQSVLMCVDECTSQCSCIIRLPP